MCLNPCPVLVDHYKLMRRAVDNVVRNALRFSVRGQTITVSLAQVEEYLQIEVADQGPGVEEDKLSSIFDPFVRVKSPLSGKGYGLGLVITRKVMLAHEGKVDARNAQPHGPDHQPSGSALEIRFIIRAAEALATLSHPESLTFVSSSGWLRLPPFCDSNYFADSFFTGNKKRR